ncbi:MULTISPECIES: PadR family transcriptional regulator [Streptomyces]|uniref:PadR family transcriptional regulator n=1 Tax=Streptomyces TaxID=1883 RepID=UPI0005BC3E0D|nr:MULTISPECIES: PadR family transcriptional regulator [Streptomyces]MDP9947553.1 DNA-binding PadR family transcriptional regulator [Streptomyces sp. DSM 41269]
MALRHAVLAALLDEELSGYQLTKAFAAGVANFWHAKPQQVYAELARLERDGLVAGREVVQEGRPDKRLFRVTGKGLGELEGFASTAAKPAFLREDLLVQVQAADRLDAAVLIVRLTERYAFAEAKAALFEERLRRMRGGLDEAEFLLRGARVGPYLTCRRGRDFERANRDWCRDVMEVLRARQAAAEEA